MNSSKPKTVFKIRNKDTGLFSTGGHTPKWSKSGKTWSGTGPLLSHLNLYMSDGYGRPRKTFPDSWEVVEYEVVQQEGGTNTVSEWHKIMSNRKR